MEASVTRREGNGHERGCRREHRGAGDHLAGNAQWSSPFTRWHYPCVREEPGHARFTGAHLRGCQSEGEPPLLRHVELTSADRRDTAADRSFRRLKVRQGALALLITQPRPTHGEKSQSMTGPFCF